MRGHHSTLERIIKSNVNAPTNDERYRDFNSEKEPEKPLGEIIPPQTCATDRPDRGGAIVA